MKTLRTIRRSKTEIIVLAVLVFEFMFPHYSLAAAKPEGSMMLPELVVRSVDQVTAASSLTEANAAVVLISPIKEIEYKVVKTYDIPITSYSSTVDQTDSTPCITANGFDLCENGEENVIAANFLPFGTKVRIPEYFGDRIFTVQDRMNARYYYRADIWMKDRASAVRWGIKYTKIEVVE